LAFEFDFEQAVSRIRDQIERDFAQQMSRLNEKNDVSGVERLDRFITMAADKSLQIALGVMKEYHRELQRYLADRGL
jgi:hypothetical protein